MPMTARLDHIGRDNNARDGWPRAPQVCLYLWTATMSV
jgi:hypothetical protein